MPTIRTIFVHFAIGATISCAAVSAVASDPPAFRIVQRGGSTLPQSVTDRDAIEAPITGLSGITWLGDDRYAAIMDNNDKLLLFRLPIAPDGTLGDPDDLRLITLAERHDYEDIAVCPEPLRQRIAARRLNQGFPDPGPVLLLCEEDTPAIRAVSLADGSLLGVIPIPALFSTRRTNRGLEALDIDFDGSHLWTANEESLPADGPAATADCGTTVRLARIAIPEPGQQRRDEPMQLAYAVDSPHNFVRVFTGDPLSGVAALTVLGDGRLLVLERSGCPGLPPFENRIYLVDTRSAPDVSAIDRELAQQPDEHVAKALLWRDQLGCNLEGLCLGPKLRGTSRSVVGIADNNGIGTPNQLIGFVLEEAAGGIPVSVVAVAVAVAVVAVGSLLCRLAR
jgi:hypothetical protein